MKYEKSCGAVVYRYYCDRLELLLIKHKAGGHWSFPKGHVEDGETEEQTALREVKEETGLTVALEEGFRESVRYHPRPDLSKTVVYFIGEAVSGKAHAQEEEIDELRWVALTEVEPMLTYANDRKLLARAKRHLC